MSLTDATVFASLDHPALYDKPEPLPPLPLGSVSAWLARDGHCLLLAAGVPQAMTGQSGSFLHCLDRRLINGHCCPEGAELAYQPVWGRGGGLKAESLSELDESLRVDKRITADWIFRV